jgi:gliding motility-associated-like protein
MQEAFYTGETDATKVDGYAAITNKQSFTFPVGDARQLRPLILNSEGVNTFAKCAYFREDPNNPSTFPSFPTTARAQTIAAVSSAEFWRLEGSVPSTVSLSWNPQSNLAAIAANLNSVTLMGWSKSAGRWLSLGQEGAGGDLDNGFVSSAPFVPDEYEIITFGSLAEPTDILSLDNYLLTPNGDGVNDFLEIIELEQSPHNKISIFDRNGLKVFEMVNYTNEFTGTANVDNLVINKKQGLPEGIYFYVIRMDDLGLNYQGFLYLER